MIKKIKHYLPNIVISVLRIIFGVDRSRVLFLCFGGKFYADNTRAVSEALHKLNPKLKIVWIFNNPDSKKNVIPDYIKTVKSSNLAFCFNLAVSGCIVSNNGFMNFNKSKKQFLVQVWHGDRAFKKILYDSNFASKSFFLPEEKEGFCNLAVAGSKYGEMQFRSAFRYKGEILMKGTPRDDILVFPDANRISKIKQELKIGDNKKIFLYAPTLRRKNSNDKTLQQKQEIDLEKTLEVLDIKTNEEWVCLVRAHPAMLGIGGVAFSDKIIDVSSYEDMADLLLVSDMLITDYSSSAGDFALLHRPLILFQSDRKEYLEKDRELYFAMEDSPYFVAENQEDLQKIIQDMTEEIAYKNCEDILKFYGNCETGKASEYVAERICSWIDKK